MPKHIELHKVLISAPGDIDQDDEVKIVKSIIENFNRIYGDRQGIILTAKYWRDDAYASMAGPPQSVINSQVVDDCDAVVAIFWTRFGSPTEMYGSGTEEEIERLRRDGKQVFLYFSERPVKPGYDQMQWEKVCAFKDRVKKQGLYFTYSDLNEFETLIERHLTGHFLSVGSGTPNVSIANRNSRLNLKTHDGARLLDSIVYTKTQYTETKYMDDMRNNAVNCFNKIQNISLQEPEPPNPERQLNSQSILIKAFPNLDFSNLNRLISGVSIAQEDQEMIKEFAYNNDLVVDDRFFNLGKLTESNIMPLNGPSLHGSEEEKLKYSALQDLIYKVSEYQAFKSFFEEMDRMHRVEFVVSNDGQIFDRNLQVTIFVKEGVVILPPSIKIPDYPAVETVNKVGPEVFFCPKQTDYIQSYPDYPPVIPSVKIPSADFLGRPYYRREDETHAYTRKIERLTSIQKFSRDNMDIFQINISYLKHNETVAFPVYLFFKDTVDEVKYRITSENVDCPVETVIRCAID